MIQRIIFVWEKFTVDFCCNQYEIHMKFQRMNRIIVTDIAILLPSLIMIPVGWWIKTYGLDYIYYVLFGARNDSIEEGRAAITLGLTICNGI